MSRHKLQNTFTFFEKLRKIRQNVALYPFLFGLVSLFLGLMMIYFERQGASYKFTAFFDIYADNFGSGTSLLTSLVGAIISVLTFSYSTLLVLLNQATSNYSPRVMPNLLTIRGHKIVLGLYVGMIVYNIVLILGFDVLMRPPVLSVVSGIIYAVVCIFSFIYFINSVIKEIQPDKIMKDILNDSLENLDYIKRKVGKFSDPRIRDFSKIGQDFEYSYNSTESGSLTINYKRILKVSHNLNTDVKILVKNGDNIFANQTLFTSKKPLTEENANNIMDCLMVDTSDDDINYNYVFGIKRLSEIGLKAMSPGVNDPITATSAIFYLSILLNERIKNSDVYYVRNNDEGGVYFDINDFENLLYFVMSGLRTYAIKDVYCLIQIYKMFANLMSVAMGENILILKNAIKVLKKDYESKLNDWDKNYMNSLFDPLLTIEKPY